MTEEITPPRRVWDLAAQRLIAQSNGEFKYSDQLREEINSLGWAIKDDRRGYSFAKLEKPVTDEKQGKIIDEETPCPKRDDEIHCVCWWEGEACCACDDPAFEGKEGFYIVSRHPFMETPND